MRLGLFLIIVLFAACNSRPLTNDFVKSDWQIVEIVDGKNGPGTPLSMQYQYQPVDSLRPLMYFINDTNYVLRHLFDESIDTNYFQIRGDTLITNREPNDFLVIVKGKNDSAFLINQPEQLVITLVKAQ